VRGWAAALAVGLLAAPGLVGTAGAAAEPNLAIMVLPPDQAGSAITGLRIDDSQSGPRSAAQAAQEDLDPCTLPGAERGRGLVAGYRLSWSDPDQSALRARSGVNSFATTVDRFADASAASRELRRRAGEVAARRGKVVAGGAVLESAHVQHLSGLGDEAVALSGRERAGGARVWVTVVGFRHGDLLAAAEVQRADAKPAVADMRRLAKALDARIAGVLAGRVTGSPVAIPGERSVPAAPGVPDLAAAALRPSDVGPGSFVLTSRYVATTSSLAEQKRDIAPGCRSTLAGATSDLDVYPNAAVASAVLHQVGALSSATLANLLERGAGGGLRVVSIRRAPLRGVGDEALRFDVRYREAPIGAGQVQFIFLRTGRIAGTVLLISRPGKGAPAAQAIRAARAVAGRARTALRAGSGGGQPSA